MGEGEEKKRKIIKGQEVKEVKEDSFLLASHGQLPDY